MNSGADEQVEDSFDMHCPEKVTICIPVYNALPELKECVSLLEANQCSNTDIVICNDCSPDEEVGAYLENLDDSVFTIMCNPENLGYTRTINQMIEATEGDVILLNSDARPYRNFSMHLQQIAYQSNSTATTTAVSDNAGAFSFPDYNEKNNLPEWLTEEDAASLLADRFKLKCHEVPTGSGFLHVYKTIYLNDVGLFDYEKFPMGYGEENEFCMRGAKKGWKHIIAPSVYVGHERTSSFGEKKNKLVKVGVKKVNELYPHYNQLCANSFVRSNTVKESRFNARATLLQSVKPHRTRVLYVLGVKSGGTPQTNLDLLKALKDDQDSWLFYSDKRTSFLNITLEVYFERWSLTL